MKKILGIAILLRFPSLFEPNWYGDEGIYQVIGQAVAAGRLLYEGIWDNKPPLLYVMYAIFNGDQFWVRLTSLIVMVFTIIAFFSLAKKLLTKGASVSIATALFALLFATPLLEGNIANSENFMYLPIMLAIYIALFKRVQFVAGLLFAIAFLIKIVAIFDIGALLVFLFIRELTKNAKKWLVDSTLLGIGFALPVVVTLFYFVLQGVFADFFTATFSQNVTYVGTSNQLLLKLVPLAVFCAFLFWYRERLSKETLFIYLWLGFSVFNAFFGGRPWTHYLLTLLPSFALFVGVIIENSKLRVLHIAACLLLFYLIAKNFWIYGKTVSYYVNFAAFATGAKDERAYRNFFDWYVNRDYAIADYIKSHSTENDTIFIWGDNAQIYALSQRLPVGRYAVSYHITFYPNAVEETKTAITGRKPVFIIAIRDDIPAVFLDDAYQLQHEIEGAKIYGRKT